jgi:hypothetical protein
MSYYMYRFQELSEFKYWIDRSAQSILDEVATLPKGWGSVFPRDEKFPLWASKIRNYFNLIPKTLKLQPRGSNLAHNVNRISRVIPHSSTGFLQHIATLSKNQIIAERTFSGDYYRDNNNLLWFQMSPGSTVYHYKHFFGNTSTAIANDALGQDSIPVFKLVQPDISKCGSSEIILRNRIPRKERLQWHNDVNPYETKPDLVTDVVLQGSYNYQDAAVVGKKAHEWADENSHRSNRGFYMNPPNPFSPLSQRFFRSYVLPRMSLL